GQPAEVVVVQAQQVHVDEQQIHFGIADAFADPEAGAVHAVHALLDRCERVGETEAAIAVAVPVDADVFAHGLNDFAAHETDELADALWRRVSDRVREADAARAGA